MIELIWNCISNITAYSLPLFAIGAMAVALGMVIGTAILELKK